MDCLSGLVARKMRAQRCHLTSKAQAADVLFCGVFDRDEHIGLPYLRSSPASHGNPKGTVSSTLRASGSHGAKCCITLSELPFAGIFAQAAGRRGLIRSDWHPAGADWHCSRYRLQLHLVKSLLASRASLTRLATCAQILRGKT